jgi:hypothetical protein
MASLASFYTPPPTLPGVESGNLNLARDEARLDAGYEAQKIRQQFGRRTLPDLINRFSSRGTARAGGSAILKARAAEDSAQAEGDIQWRLARTLAGLTRAGILAQAPGVNISG